MVYKEKVVEKGIYATDLRRSDDSLKEVVDGIKIYFDRALGNILLYQFERGQYLEIRKAYPDKQCSEIYGAEHLLRLFGK